MEMLRYVQFELKICVQFELKILVQKKFLNEVNNTSTFLREKVHKYMI